MPVNAKNTVWWMKSLFKNLVRSMEKIVDSIILMFFLLGFLIGMLFTAVWRKVLPYLTFILETLEHGYEHRTRQARISKIRKG